MFNFGQSSSFSNPQTSTSSNFGGFNYNNQPAANNQGNQANQAPAQNSYGSSTGGLFGSSLGQQPASSYGAQPLSSLSQQTSTGVMYPRDTNFIDLSADLRKAMEDFEKTIQGHSDACRPFSNRIDPTEQLDQIENKLSLLEEKIAAYSSLNAHQTSRISNLKKATSGHWRYSENAARTIEASRSIVDSTSKKVTWTRAFAPNDPTALHFEEILKEMNSQMNEAEEMAEALRKQIEPFTSGNGNTSLPSPTESVKFLIKTELEICSLLQRRYNQIRDEIELMKRNYRTFCSKYRGDSRDPFVPKVIENEERELERGKKKDFFGLNNLVINNNLPPSSTTPISNSLLSMLPASTTNLPSATTGLPAKSSSLGLFSFGR